jgi:hemolysin III
LKQPERCLKSFMVFIAKYIFKDPVPRQANPSYQQTHQEERINVLTHGLMAILFTALLPFAVLQVQRAIPGPPPVAAISVFVFCCCLVLMFVLSAIYHSLPQGSRAKHLFNRLDHMAIYFAIAGSYTPVALVIVGGTAGWLILILEWSLVLAGIFFKLFAFRKNRVTAVFSMVLYLLMGWAILLVLPIFIQQALISCLMLIVAGGLSYTAGIFFYARQKPYSHVIWHLFVNAGAACHFLALVLFL